MSVAELKINIVEKIDSLSEQQLSELNHFIDQIDVKAPNESDLMQHIDNIVAEREELLEKLAQ